jgi:FPC/CPF motif-containing protein YcgG
MSEIDRIADTWLCFEAKQVFGDLAADTEGASYAWSKIAIFTSWNFQTNASLIVCFDSPEGFPTQLKEALTVNAELVSLRNPYVVHHVVLEEVLALYDKCVWSMRDAVREVEQVSSRVA